MASIQLPGLSTGLDTATIVAQLMQVERRRLTMFESSIAKRKETRTAVNELQSKLNAFKSALGALSNASQLRAYNATSSNSDKLSISAAAGANESSHSVKIKQLATANRWVHDGFKYATSYVGTGTFIFSYNNQEVIIQTNDTTTLQDMVNMINNDPKNPGVNAGILKYDDGSGNPFHLVLNGRESGTDFQIAIHTSNAEVHTAASLLTIRGVNATLTGKLSELTDFSGQDINFRNVNEVAIAGALNDGTAVNTTVSVNPYTTVEDLIGEIEAAFGDTVKVTLDEGQLKIIDKTTGVRQMALSVSFNTDTETAVLAFNQTAQGGSINADIAAFAPSTFLETQRAQDSLVKVDDYPPDIVDSETGQVIEERWISRSANTVDDVINGVTLNLHGTTANAEGGHDAIQINMTRNTEALKSNIQAMMDAYNAVVMYFDEQTKYDPETNTSGILSHEFGLVSLRSIIRSPFISNAIGFGGSDAFINPRDLGFSFGADQMLKLDQEKFDEAITQDYRGVLNLIGAQKTGSSTGADAAFVKFHNSSQYTQAGTFDVHVEIDAEGNITSAQIKLADEDWAQARDAEFSGSYVFGVSGDLNARNPEMDLQIVIDTTQTGRTLEASINIRQGFAGNLQDLANSATDIQSGRTSVSIRSIDSQISNLNKRIEQEEARLERFQSRLTNQYARMERLMTTIQQQFSGLGML